MSDADKIKQAINATDMWNRNTVLSLYGPQIALLHLLYKLNIVGMRRVTWSYAQMISHPGPLENPPCSIRLATVNLQVEFLQFCPKRMADEDLRDYKP
jgi:hypothetical protein